MPDKKIKIFIPFSSTLNTGDAGILISTLNSIKRVFGDECEVLVASHQSEIAKEYYPSINYMETGRNLNDKIFNKSITRIPRNYFILLFDYLFNFIPKILLTNHEIKLLKEIKKADIILSPGGGYLTDSYFIQFSLALYNYTLRKNKKLYFYSQSIGPVWRKSSIFFLRRVLQKAGKIIVRDHESILHLTKLFPTLPDSVFESADEVFTLKQPELIKKSETKRIGISVRSWNFSNTNVSREEGMLNYTKTVQQACRHLIDSYNYEITFISTCQGHKEYIDDSKTAALIVSQLEDRYKSSITIDIEFHPLNELIEIYKSFDVFIGTRMHSIIFNFLNLTPCIGIIYEFKTSELFERIGLEKYLFEMQSSDQNELISKIDDLIMNKNLVQQQLHNEIKKLRAVSLQNMIHVHNHFVNNTISELQ
ncbi:MAG: polysaccharide pyruvyl transferase family protein [Bacteroidetes bacterium]|nr:polysaccharide pyruvyl transferase family protein [Bacteroidota bacterium]